MCYLVGPFVFFCVCYLSIFPFIRCVLFCFGLVLFCLFLSWIENSMSDGGESVLLLVFGGTLFALLGHELIKAMER